MKTENKMKKQIKAKPTYYSGTTFRSKSEAQLAVMFDLARIEWEYEPDVSGELEWTPDFLIRIKVGGGVYGEFISVLIEYKPKEPIYHYKEWWRGQVADVFNNDMVAMTEKLKGSDSDTVELCMMISGSFFDYSEGSFSTEILTGCCHLAPIVKACAFEKLCRAMGYGRNASEYRFDI